MSGGNGDIVATATFDPISRQTVSAEIRQRIADAIESGKFAPGEPLPAERVLCLEFGVARTSVREAIQGLVIAGYVERRGNRSVVAERLPEVNFTGDDRKALVTQLFEVRQVIEPAIAEMAPVGPPTSSAPRSPRSRPTNTKQLEEFRELDHQFHAAHRPGVRQPAAERGAHQGAGLAVRLRRAGLDAVRRGEPERGGEIIASSLAAHRAIAEAVVRGHARKAVAAVVAHLDDVERRMVERLL